MAKRMVCVRDLSQNEIIRKVDVTDMPYRTAEKLVAYVRRQLDPKRYTVDVAWYALYLKTPSGEGPVGSHMADAWFFSPGRTAQYFSGRKAFWDTNLGIPWAEKSEEK